MPIATRLMIALVAALLVGGAIKLTGPIIGSAWVVSPQQIAAAKAAGKPGVETAPGSVAVLPIRSEIADVVDKEYLFFGFAAGMIVFTALAGRGRSVK